MATQAFRVAVALTIFKLSNKDKQRSISDFTIVWLI
jgi:hypothetical protein